MTMSESVEEFLEAADWLGPEHAPQIAALRAAARELDIKMVAGTLSQFRLLHAALLAERPKDDVPDDDDDLFGPVTVK